MKPVPYTVHTPNLQDPSLLPGPFFAAGAWGVEGPHLGAGACPAGGSWRPCAQTPRN